MVVHCKMHLLCCPCKHLPAGSLKTSAGGGVPVQKPFLATEKNACWPHSSPPPDETALNVEAMLRRANARDGSANIRESDAGANEYAQK